ncbi:UDP-N-acetylglucosamine 1-carboxyvinyltransferase [Candidatus Rhodobacter oscarellae]|uniref:UDP-N-acetylglucosamine 1-carboxyvinyltransferase n=1 Tax=Candidatus Rhodobacter oscarellae TaxID=1675527 RepID=A0A0J9EDH4_9RHOB|nr:UDP-N-acetylglucosamine 1-carboxyvinyltransferase [Candidatus Rhodobacter lobularis]KMW59774.1 UDP-N-acetylglucosamine 1-carboxyvinyltransferase [Candidatus Rhodobacter lobularis]
MDSILVKGGAELSGEIPIAGAKNTCLKLMCASLLSEDPLTLTNVPRLSDVRTLTTLLQSLGCEVAFAQNGGVMMISAADLTSHEAHYDIVRKMRASFNVLGPLMGRDGRAVVSLPGGCAIGARKVDFHIAGLEAMGAKVDLKDGYVHASAPQGLRGAEIEFPFASVGATENVMCAAVRAKGTTVIKNAAREPDTVALADCLIAMGADIEGAGSSEMVIRGVDALRGATHPVITDRIELGTYMIAPAIAGGEVELLGGERHLVASLADKLEGIGVEVTQTNRGLKVARKNGRVAAVDVTTAPFPGFPTDLQAQMMSLLCTADGVSHLEETIFENRFMHAPELIRMGADITVSGGTATVRGVERMRGAPVMATDLRASVSLILAGLAAEGETLVSRVYHLDRGYERLEEKLSNVGALVERVAA